MSYKQLLWTNRKHIELLQDSLNKNHISVTSTDTILGFLGNLTQESFNLLTKLKNERANKPFLVLIGSASKLFHFVDPAFLKNSKKLLCLIENCWPGPLTIIFRAKDDLPAHLCSKERTVALRCPNHDGLHLLLQHFDGLFSTSANQTGKTPPTTIDQIDPEILQSVAYLVVDEVVQGSKTDRIQVLPSTIIDASDEKKLRVVRVGALPIKELEKYYGSKIEFS